MRFEPLGLFDWVGVALAVVSPPAQDADGEAEDRETWP
jgi:hypothetical protein